MENLRKIMVGLLIILALTIVVANAQNQCTRNEMCNESNNSDNLKKGFSLIKGEGYYIPHGSIVQFSEGETTVKAPSGKIILKLNDSNSPKVSIPKGNSLPATHSFQIPSGSSIHKNGNINKIYKDGNRVLTVINKNKGFDIPDYGGWIEWADTEQTYDLSYFDAKWDVPDSPPDSDTIATDFLFNSLTEDDTRDIIQPVIEYNNNGQNDWFARAYYVDKGTAVYKSEEIELDVGDTVLGKMDYCTVYPHYDDWLVYIENQNTGESTDMYVGGFRTSDLEPDIALEGYDIEGDNDVPGDTIFEPYELLYNGNTVDVDFNEEISSSADDILSDLDVVILPSEDRIKLLTAN